MLKLENVRHKYRWSHGCYKKVVLSKQKDSSQVFLDSLKISFWCGLILLKLNISWIKIWKTWYPKHFPNGRQATNFFNTTQQVWVQRFFKKEIQNVHVSNINDNGDNNEKTKCLKAWVGIFWVAIFLVRIFQGEFSTVELDRWNFSGW